jgi:hypothetical protein
LRAGAAFIAGPYATREEQTARESNSAAPYFRLKDSLCRSFLKQATDPGEFTGLKLMFPLIREFSLLRAVRAIEKVSLWMHLAFLAGHDLGRAHPERLEEVLPGGEMRGAVMRLGIIERCSGEEHLTYQGLRRAYARIVEAQWAKVPEEQVEGVLLRASVKSFRVGFAAATVSQGDPAHCEFVWDIPERARDGIDDIAIRLMIGAPMDALGKPVAALLEHPLLRMARELYPAQPVECETVLDFLRGHLRALGVEREDECPSSDLDLADWVAAGMAYGRQVKERRPDILNRIFQENDGERLEGSLDVVKSVLAEAGGTNPIQLVGRLKRWQKDTYRSAEPGYYGDELARVAYFSDFAVWIPWVEEDRDDRRGLPGRN